MKDNSLISMNVDSTVVTDVLNKQIRTAIIRELDKMPELMDSIISIAMKQKVSADGKVSTYSSENKYDFIDIVSRNAIQAQAKVALQEWVEENKDKIKEALKKVLSKNTDGIAGNIVYAMVENAKSQYAINVNLDIEKQKVY